MERDRVFGKRILLVDDDPSALESIKLLLSIDRHVVTAAANGKQALELAAQEAFELVILDYAMPEMRGSDLARNLKLLHPNLPVLMISAYVEKLTASDKPVDAVLAKPFGFEALRAAVAQLTA